MKERPILFSASMVRAILGGEKTQTRRVCKQGDFSQGMLKGGDWANAIYPARESGWIAWQGRMPAGPELEAFTKTAYANGFACPYGESGDHLWVRETWRESASGVEYRADTHNDGPPDGKADSESKHWRPSIFMLRAHSRITLEVVNVRAERVQDISEADAIAEGMQSPGIPAATTNRGAFAQLWNTINQKRGFGWDVNPWCWVVTFRKV